MVINKVILKIGIAAALGFFSLAGFSQDFLSWSSEKDIKLVIGEIVIINVSSPQRVSLQDPKIADISKVAEKEVIISGKHPGSTILVIWDQEGKKEFKLTVFAQDLDQVMGKLKKLINEDLKISNVNFKKNEAAGRVIIIGEVTEKQKTQIETVLAEFATKDDISIIDNLITVRQESKMVEIECQILELSKNDLDDLGVEWNQFFDVREEPYAASSSTTGVNTSLSGVSPWTGLWSLTRWSRDAVISKINTLVQRGDGKVLSRPRLLCLSGQEAKLSVGGEVPYVSATATGTAGTGVSIEYKEYGVILTLSPTVLEDERIVLNMSTEVSELDWVNDITVAGISVPAFLTRKANTVVNVVSGDTIFIGGLIKSDQSRSIDKFPGLSSIPILGALFRSKRFQDDQTEMVITLMPVLRESKKEQPSTQALTTEVKAYPQEKAYTVLPGYLKEDANLTSYCLYLQNLISRSLLYPRLAEDAGWQGVVKLKMHLNFGGELLDVTVSESSGYLSFDEEVIKTAKSLSPYPAFPSNIEIEDLWLDIPIVYKMEY